MPNARSSSQSRSSRLYELQRRRLGQHLSQHHGNDGKMVHTRASTDLRELLRGAGQGHVETLGNRLRLVSSNREVRNACGDAATRNALALLFTHYDLTHN